MFRHMFTDWDEYLDSSGRKFYYNMKTREKSWKPPRRIRGGSSDGGGGYSAPTSPDPFMENGGDSAFEMSPGLSESESRSVDDEVQVDRRGSGGQGDKSSHAIITAVRGNKEELLKDDVRVVKEEVRVVKEEVRGICLDDIPSGYERKTDVETGEVYFVNVFTGIESF